MKNLYIIGARGFGREVYNLAKETNSYQKEYEKLLSALQEEMKTLYP